MCCTSILLHSATRRNQYTTTQLLEYTRTLRNNSTEWCCIIMYNCDVILNYKYNGFLTLIFRYNCVNPVCKIDQLWSITNNWCYRLPYFYEDRLALPACIRTDCLPGMGTYSLVLPSGCTESHDSYMVDCTALL